MEKPRYDDPDETEGRALYRARADATANAEMNLAKRRYRMVSDSAALCPHFMPRKNATSRRGQDVNMPITRCDKCGTDYHTEDRFGFCPHERRNSSPIFNSLTPAQQRHCEFMGFDPDNPDVPLD